MRGRSGLAALLVTGCAAETPEALSLQQHEPTIADRDEVVLAWAEPDAPPPAPTAEPNARSSPVAPRLRLSHPERRAADDRPPADESEVWVSFERCDFAVEAYGFPAISHDGRYIVDLFRDEDWESDGGEGIEWIDAGEPEPYRELGAVLRDLETGTHEDLSLATTATIAHRGQYVACHEAETQLEDAVREFNAKLAQHAWRKMVSAEQLGISVAADPDEAASLGEQPRAERGLELVAQQRTLILRDPGVRVLHRQPTGWKPRDPACFNYPMLSDLYVDTTSGAAIVRLAATCTCFGTEGIETEIMRLSADTITRINARAATVDRSD